ncbi:hypothetical protein FGG08_000482 [Glutinoglossum americanum]|uniref:Protein kinase domain-containing protein n=1 Tax=Glutinoglossum americanum TaxID=1670608 RepID=A0A9P8IFE2_9PEZI|nr:hypothetical protein FGG08_000482 [Glutinoglossum americanum]
MPNSLSARQILSSSIPEPTENENVDRPTHHDRDGDEWGFDSPLCTRSDLRSSDMMSINLFEETITATRNGIATMTSLSEFTSLLSRLGVDGPRHFKNPLRMCGVKVGEGSQFTVFKTRSHDLGADYGTEGDVVMKRVNITRLEIGRNKNLALNPQYRARMRTLELEVLSLCHPNIRGHRNIVSLVAWGYDYDDGATPLPVLFVEAAVSTLSTYLALTPWVQRWDVRQHLALDIAAGLAIMHQFNIVHGDVKPDNVLIFKQDNPKAPFVAKLSDFGVCIDMQTADSELTPESYRGTPAWTGPEVGNFVESKYGEFSARLLLRFDSFSYGMVLLAIFVTSGDAPKLGQNREAGEADADVAVRLLVERGDFPSGYKDFKMPLVRALRGLLAEQPTLRPLPSPDILKSDTTSYRDWLLESEVAPKTGRQNPGSTGIAYWNSLDSEVLSQLDLEYEEYESSRGVARFPSETLFGIAQRFAKSYSGNYINKTLKYVLAAAKQGHSPAQAICRQVFEAQNRPLAVDPAELDEWALRAVSEGFLFTPKGALSPESYEEARKKFRRSGGYCSDKFRSIPTIIGAAREASSLRTWTQQHRANYIVDSGGNCMLHVTAALGETEAVRFLLDSVSASIDIQNDSGETPIYKACQGGHADVVRLLLERGANASLGTASCNITPLHWLFNFHEADIPGLGRRLAGEGRAGVNTRASLDVTPEAVHQQSIPSFHYPFSWPPGSPLHWAAFAGSRVAMETLLNLGASIDLPCEAGDGSTTALTLATLWGDPEVIRYLLSKGADPTITDSKGRSLLHLMSSSPTPSHADGFCKQFQYWVRHGKWSNHLKVVREIVSLLVGAGVDIECKAKTYHKYTPIMWASEESKDMAVTYALLENRADINNIRGILGRSLLHAWAEVDARILDYPEAYPFTLAAIARETIDRNASDLAGCTALHAIANRTSVEQARNSVTILAAGNDGANIESQNRDGLTPLLYALGGRDDPAARGEIFLEFGAQPDFVTPQGQNTLSRIAGNDCFMDSESSSLIKKYTSLIVPHKRSAFVAATNISALWNSCSFGRYATVEYLLNLGMSDRINEVCHRSRRSALDLAFIMAEKARRNYIMQAGRYKPGRDRDAAMEGKACFAYGYGYGTKETISAPGLSSREVVEEAYWSFPKLICLLQNRGALPARDLTSPPLLLPCELNPSWFDTWEIYGNAVLPESQPNRAHWNILYALERLPEDWEEQLAELQESIYEDPRILPQVLLLERSARVRGFVRRRAAGPWVKALLMSMELVEVRIVGGEIVEVRGEDGRPVDIRKR